MKEKHKNCKNLYILFFNLVMYMPFKITHFNNYKKKIIVVYSEQKDLINLLIGELVSTYDRHVNVSQMPEKVLN